jgi:ferric-dicitrate binding protein FerR (iron transport regulator)
LYAKAIGTAFNIETNKESDFIKTTLVEGHLAVTEYRSKKSQSLQAGQQASFNNGSFIIYDTLDLQQITAWTRGEFNFNENSIYEIMEKIGLWYNVKIKYEGEMPTKLFSLSFLKLVPLSEAAAIISKGLQLNVKPEADTLIVSPGN